MATISAIPFVGMLAGAEICSEKLLVMVKDTEICREGSATLCAVNVTLEGDGRFLGAVKLPLASTVPQPPVHAGPERLQRTEVSGCPLLKTVARNGCVAPSSTLAEFGVRLKVMSLITVRLALPDFVESAWLVAVIWTVAGEGKSGGAV